MKITISMRLAEFTTLGVVGRQMAVIAASVPTLVARFAACGTKQKVNLMAVDKNVECRFSECDDCLLDGTDALCCMASRLGLACHRFAQSIPIINLLISSKQCELFTKV